MFCVNRKRLKCTVENKMADLKVSVEKLNDQNYGIWKFKMRLLLTREKVLSVVSEPKPENADAAWVSKDETAQALIGLALEDSQLIHVMQKTTAKEMWDALKDYHERASLSSKIHVVRKLVSIRMCDGECMAEHLKAMAELRLRLTALGEEMKDHWFVALMLSSLPASYDGLIMALESRPDADLTVDFVKGKLLDEGRRRVEISGEEKAFATASAGEKQKYFSEKQKVKKNKDKVCHYCKKEGHFRRDCRKLAQDRQDKERANVAAESDSELEMCLAAGNFGGRAVWYLDSGATSHMTCDASILSDMDRSKEATICLADGNSIKSTGAGCSKISCVNGKGAKVKVGLENVFHVPSLASNLLSVSRIADLGLTVVFEKSECKILKGSEVVLIGQRKGGLYYLKQFQDKALLSETKHSDLCEHLWHRRLGHRDSEAVKKIVRENLGLGLNINRCDITTVCSPCYQGKMCRDPFPKASKSRASEVGELVHSDLGGPMEVATPRGNRFYIILVDDYSRYSVIYLLQHKSDAEEKVREYCNMVKNQFGHYPKCIRSDGGGEYSGRNLKNFFAEHGIVHQMSAPYSPQQNGVAERKNRYLKEMMRCMLAESGLDKKFWGEAINTANYLQNRCPSSSIVCTPYEMWAEKKPSYSHLRVFGSEAYVYIPKEKRRALDLKSEKLVFVGYAEGRKAYRFLNVQSGLITISRDAKFLEQCNVKESVPEQPVSENFVDVPLLSPPDELSAVENASAVPDDSTDAESYASGDDSSFHGFPQDEIVRRSQRSTKGIPATRLIEEIFAAGTIAAEPKNFREAMACEQKEEWKAAMADELQSHLQNGTWDLVHLPEGRKPVGCRWVYKIKENAAGEIIKYKARLVAQGFLQTYGEDYDEVFAPVTTHTTFRLLLALASKKQMKLKHFDVKTAYLHGKLDEVLYMVQPPGHVVRGKESMVCRLRRSIYGLKQSARCWNKCLDAALKNFGFKQSTADACLYTKYVRGKIVYLLVYVDDILVGCMDESEINVVYNQLKNHFEMTDLGDLSYFLGMEVIRDVRGYSISLEGYINRTIDKFGLRNAKEAKTPMETGYVKEEDRSNVFSDSTAYRSLVGALLYISVCARPDIAVSASILGRKVSAPTEADWVAAKRVLRYLKATKGWQLQYNNAGDDLVGFSDADWAGDIRSRKSTTGFVYLYAGGAVSWCSRKQTSVTLSSMESEYVALSEASQELVWLLKLLKDIGEPYEGPVTVMEDNQSCITFVGSERTSRRSKHVETREHYVRNLCNDQMLKLKYCPSEDMVADILTKPLSVIKQKKFAKMMGLVPCSGIKC